MPTYIRTRSEFAVNSFSAENQTGPSVATFADGGFIVTWTTTDSAQDGDGGAIKAQLFDSAGSKVGSEFRVNATGAGSQNSSEVETFANGNFVVSWVSQDDTNLLRLQLFGRDGVPLGSEIQINSSYPWPSSPNIAMLANGNFIVSWDEYGNIRARIFDSAGVPVGGQLTLNTYQAEGYGDLVALANGGFLATWRTTTANSWDVKAQLFNASGGKVGSEFLVNTVVAGSQNAPGATALADGGFVITWSESNPEYSSGNTRIKAQLYTASGVKSGGELLVSTTGAYSMGGQVVTALPDGGFIVAWYNTRLISGGGSDSEVMAQRFSASGAKVDGEFQINTVTAGSQWLPDLATMADGRVVAVWSSGTGDIGGSSVRAQILGTELAAPLPNTAPTVISDGGGASASLFLDEGLTAVTRVVASDDGEPNNLRYSITGGADSALFTINALNGLLAFKQAPDHEAPLDQGADNVYSVTVSVSDGSFTDSQSIQVSIHHVNYITIVSDGGWDYASVSVDENETAVTVVSAVDDDGLPLTYSISGQDAGAFTIDSQTGELSFIAAPDYESPGSVYGENVYYIQVKATDGTRSDTQDIAVYVNDVVEPDGFGIISDGAGDSAEIAVDENRTAVTTVAVQGAVGEVTYEIVGGKDASYFTIDAQTGELAFVYAPDFEERDYYWGSNNTYGVIVRASDGVSSDEQELYVNVQNVDEAPVFRSYGGQEHVLEWMWENSRIVTYVGAEDPDRYSELTYGIEGGADAHLFEVDPYSGELRFKADADHEALADSDGDNWYEVAVGAYSGALSSTQSFSIWVEDQYERVEITSGGGEREAEVIVAENSALATVVTARGDNYVYYEIVGGRDSDAFAINWQTGELEFVSRPDFEHAGDFDGDNVYEVTVRASNDMTSDIQRLYLIVQNVVEPPVFFDWSDGPYPLWVPENGVYASSVSAYAPEGGPAFTYSITGGADSDAFRVDAQSGFIYWLPGHSPDFEAPADADGDNIYELEITAAQGSWSRAQAFTFTIYNQNEAPDFQSGGGGDSAAVTVDENGGDVLDLLAVDPEGATPQYAVSGGADAALFEIDPATGTLRFKSAPDFEIAGDADGDNVYEVVVSATDGQKSDYQTVSVTLANVYEGISFAAPAVAFTVDEETAPIGAVAALGDSESAIVYAISGGADASLFEIDPATGALSWVAEPDYEEGGDSDGDNVYDLVVSASDGRSGADQAVSITVDDVFEPLEIVSYGGAQAVSLTLTEGYWMTGIVVQSVDEEGFGTFDTVVYAITGGADAALFTINPNTGALDFTYDAWPDFEAPGDAGGDNVYDVVVTASTSRSSDTQAFAIAIANMNEGIFITSNNGANSVSLAMNEGDRAVTTVVAEDPDGTAPAYSIVGGADAALFEIDPATGALTFVDAPDYEGAGDNLYSVEVAASDGEEESRQTIQVRIDNVNEGVTITSGGGGEASAVTVAENGTAVASLFATDVDGDAVTYAITGGSDSSRFVIDALTGALRFLQAPNFEAPADSDGDNVYDVVISATDGAFTDSQTVAVTVSNLAEIVAITSNGGGDSASVAVPENGKAVATVAAANPDGGGAVTYAIAGGADAARFTIDSGTGILAFAEAPNFEAPADSGADNVYDVVVSASNGTTVDTQALAVTVGNADEQMAITSNGGGASALVSANENAIAVTTVVGTDPDGGPVTYAIVGGGDSALFTIDSTTGVLAFRAAPNFEAPGDSGGDNVYDVVVMASDGLWSDTQAIAVRVGNVNEAPVITSGGGGAGGSVSMVENSLAVTVVSATDQDGGAASYSIVGGADAARFTIDAQTGALRFVAAPDWELPADSNQDNVYSVVVRASDGQLFDDQALSVSVTNTRDGNNVTGTSGGDSISATSTNVALRTSNEEDLVFGRDGHDTIHGMGGADELYGEAGNDVLVGGAGADKLLGGLGKDQFVYNALSESAGAFRDLIMDFSRAQGDKISLSAIDANSLVSNNQAFSFIGTSAFSNVAGQLRYETSAGVTTISGDVNGDGLADLQIQLSGSIALIASDFIL